MLNLTKTRKCVTLVSFKSTKQIEVCIIQTYKFHGCPSYLFLKIQLVF